MSRLIAASLLIALLLCRPCPSAAHDAAAEAGLGLSAAVLSVVYLPVKVVIATAGGVVGAATGFLTGGDVRSAYGIWVPTAGGTYFVRPAHLDGTEPFEFFGSDYDDRPSANGANEDVFYDAMYESR